MHMSAKSITFVCNQTPTGTCQKVVVHRVDKAVLVFVWWNDSHFLARIEILLRFILQCLCESVASWKTSVVSVKGYEISDQV